MKTKHIAKCREVITSLTAGRELRTITWPGIRSWGSMVLLHLLPVINIFSSFTPFRGHQQRRVHVTQRITQHELLWCTKNKYPTFIQEPQVVDIEIIWWRRKVQLKKDDFYPINLRILKMAEKLTIMQKSFKLMWQRTWTRWGFDAKLSASKTFVLAASPTKMSEICKVRNFLDIGITILAQHT